MMGPTFEELVAYSCEQDCADYYHQRARINNPVQGIPRATIMEEENICNDCWLEDFSWACSDAI